MTKPIRVKKKAPRRTAPAVAFHGKRDGCTNVVGVGNLRVMISHEDEDVWIAQGLEIDYAVEGSSLPDVKQQFETGLSATLLAHLRVYNSFTHVLKAAPAEMWQRFLQPECGPECVKHRFSLTAHQRQLPEMAMLPFQGINYYVPQELHT